MNHHEAHHAPAESNAREYIKFAGVVLGIVALTCVAYRLSDGSGWMEWMRIFMGVFMATFAAFKFVGYSMFVQMFPMYDLVAGKTKIYAYMYPFIELGLAGMFLADVWEFARSVLVIVIMGLGATSVIRQVYVRRNKIHCACLGNIIKLPLSTVSLVENILMVAMAVVMLANISNAQPSEAYHAQDGKLSEVTFAAAGDFGNDENAEAVLSRIDSKRADFTVALGDLGYVGNGNEEEWCKKVHDIMTGQHEEFQIIAGNHDDGTKDGDIMAYRECLPDRISDLEGGPYHGDADGEYGIEYYFDYGQLVRIILISPDIENYGFDYSEGNEHYEWVKVAIQSARANGIPWVVLGMHKNCITPGTKTCEIGEDLMNLAIEQGVDVVLQGHEHAYFRSKQLQLGPDCPAVIANEFNADCVSQQGDEFTKGEGTVFVIAGTGGRTLRDVNIEDPEIDYFEAWNGANFGNAYGFSYFKVTDDELSSNFVRVSESSFQDSFTISR